MDLHPNRMLLSTKLKIPEPRKNYVARKALFSLLSRCVDMGVIFVRGGAGTGKTTLLSTFIHESELQNVCWVSLDGANANVYSFWLYFTAAISAFWEDGKGFLELIRSNPDASHMEALLTLLINRMCDDRDYYMVLDDVHNIRDKALVRTLEFFLGAMPPNFHFFMLSREDPPVYLGPLAVAGRLLFIDGKQMQLSLEEGMAFLKNTLCLSESDEELEKLNLYADGWIGGLQLAAAAGRHSGLLLRAGGGIAAEYLTREVFESLRQEEKDFLTKTGPLACFDAEICSKLFKSFTGLDFARMIESLVHKNLFIICVDEQNGIYRYHNILSDYLTHQFVLLPEEHRRAIYIQAGGIFEKRGDYEEALREYSAAEDYDDILRVAKTMGGRIEAWVFLDKVPVDRLISDIDLAAQCFMYNFGSMNLERGRVLYEKIKEKYGGTDIFRVLQTAEPYFCKSNGILPLYEALTAEQVECIPISPIAKAMIMAQNSAALVGLMQYEEAEKSIKTAIKICTGANAFVEFFANNQLAQIHEETGRLNESLACYARSRELLGSPLMLPGVGYYFGLAGVYMRRMELEKAADALEQARLLLEAQRLHLDATDGTLAFHLAEMKFLSGDDAAGVAYVEGLVSEYSTFSVLTMGRLILELDCAGKLPDDIAASFIKELDATESYRRQPFMKLLHARLLLRQGEAVEALRETDEILIFSRQHNNKIRLVEAGLLKILILLHDEKRDGIQREIMNLLREAVHYAHDERILMPFFLDRRALLPLLRQLSDQVSGKNQLVAVQADFLHEAIAVCGYSPPTSKAQELLSARELEVLQELSLGITNREIAEKLCISQATVKTHVLSIFGKLSVSSRMKAVELGRAKGLIK